MKTIKDIVQKHITVPVSYKNFAIYFDLAKDSYVAGLEMAKELVEDLEAQSQYVMERPISAKEIIDNLHDEIEKLKTNKTW